MTSALLCKAAISFGLVAGAVALAGVFSFAAGAGTFTPGLPAVLEIGTLTCVVMAEEEVVAVTALLSSSVTGGISLLGRRRLYPLAEEPRRRGGGGGAMVAEGEARSTRGRSVVWPFETEDVRAGGRGGRGFSAVGLGLVGGRGCSGGEGSSGMLGGSRVRELRSVFRRRGGGGAGGLVGGADCDVDGAVAAGRVSSMMGAERPVEGPVCFERSWLCRRARGGVGATRAR